MEAATQALKQKAVRMSVKLECKAMNINTRLNFNIELGKPETLRVVRTCVTGCMHDLRHGLRDHIADESAEEDDKFLAHELKQFEHQMIKSAADWKVADIETWPASALRRIKDLEQQVKAYEHSWGTQPPRVLAQSPRVMMHMSEPARGQHEDSLCDHQMSRRKSGESVRCATWGVRDTMDRPMDCQTSAASTTSVSKMNSSKLPGFNNHWQRQTSNSSCRSINERAIARRLRPDTPAESIAALEQKLHAERQLAEAQAKMVRRLSGKVTPTEKIAELEEKLNEELKLKAAAANATGIRPGGLEEHLGSCPVSQELPQDLGQSTSDRAGKHVQHRELSALPCREPVPPSQMPGPGRSPQAALGRARARAMVAQRSLAPSDFDSEVSDSGRSDISGPWQSGRGACPTINEARELSISGLEISPAVAAAAGSMAPAPRAMARAPPADASKTTSDGSDSRPAMDGSVQKEKSEGGFVSKLWSKMTKS